MLFENPVGLLAERLPFLRDLRISDFRESTANKFLFSVLSNNEFREWLQNYQIKLNKIIDDTWNMKEARATTFNVEAIDREKISHDAAEALLRYGDKEIIYNLLQYKEADAQDHVIMPRFLTWIAIIISCTRGCWFNHYIDV